MQNFVDDRLDGGGREDRLGKGLRLGCGNLLDFRKSNLGLGDGRFGYRNFGDFGTDGLSLGEPAPALETLKGTAGVFAEFLEASSMAYWVLPCSRRILTMVSV
ncbi:MAG: hypothetical protein K8R69_08715 [Deltaproteobacteria bacterium]|nr:hypothetical protein [Deltaproteobacteria bacterium]